MIKKGERYIALEKVYGNFPMIRKMVISGGGNEDDARDIFQDAILIFYRLAIKPDFILSSSISTLLYSISHKLWLKKYRDFDSRRSGISEDVHGKYDLQAEEIEEEEEEEERNKLSEKVLEGLGEPCSAILKMFYYENFSMKEIASRLGYSNENTAKAQKYKCIERGKKILAESLSTLKTLLK
jgi:RNA polymerase sigma factor (sigma-70 family)